MTLARPEIRIGAVSLEWQRATYRALFLAQDCSLAERICREAVNSLESYAGRLGVFLVLAGENGLLCCDGAGLTPGEFLQLVRERRLYGKFIVLLTLQVFRRRAACREARAVWIRSRPLGAPAIAVCEAAQDGSWRDFERDAFTVFHLFGSGQAPPLQLPAETRGLKSHVVPVLPGIFALCRKMSF